MSSNRNYFSHLSKHALPSEGQLSVDVLENDTHVIVRSAIAGVGKNDLDITVTGDTLTIRGSRPHPEKQKQPIEHIKECYWGNFSRSIVLPAAVNPEETEAGLKNGVLTIRLKKAEMSSRVKITEN